MKIWNYIFIFSLLTLLSSEALAQNKKIWVTGAARSINYGDSYSNDAETDTTTSKRTESGHAMVDLGVNIQPSDKILIQSTVRVRNDYGGFWGAGVTFDVRQLYIKGIIGNFLKYQLGDINYKLTPYTFQNNVSLINQNPGLITSIPLNQVQYDLFYMGDQTWRQQGAAVDFALEFSKFLDEMQFDLFTTRVRPTNIGSLDDRLYSGGSITVLQSKNLKLGVQYANLYDLEGTSGSTSQMRNPVVTASAEGKFKLFDLDWNAALETGRSTLAWEGDANNVTLEDYFYDASLKVNIDQIDIKASYRDVGANFRSAGAQSLQLNFAGSAQAYTRYGNDQQLRALSMLDIYRDASLYNTQLTAGLAYYDPRYDNVTPYGRATPNRRGLDVLVNYEDEDERWEVEGSSAFLQHVVGEGTTALKNFTTTNLFAEVRLNKILGWESRKLWLSARSGMQNTNRSGEETFEDVDLISMSSNLNLTATIIGDLDLIAEYRSWNSNGSELIAERDEFSQIIDFSEYDIDYSETLLGAGIKYNYTDDTQISLIWQSFIWEDNSDVTLPYTINTWSLFFTMKF